MFSALPLYKFKNLKEQKRKKEKTWHLLLYWPSQDPNKHTDVNSWQYLSSVLELWFDYTPDSCTLNNVHVNDVMSLIDDNLDLEFTIHTPCSYRYSQSCIDRAWYIIMIRWKIDIPNIYFIYICYLLSIYDCCIAYWYQIFTFIYYLHHIFSQTIVTIRRRQLPARTCWVPACPRPASSCWGRVCPAPAPAPRPHWQGTPGTGSCSIM